MAKSNFKYFALCLGINLCLAAIEIFLLRPLVDFISTRYFIHLLIYSILLIAINPFITYYLANIIESKTIDLKKQ